MLTYEDCVELSDLLPDEIDAIAEHEHIPAMAAMEMGHYLLEQPDGTLALKRMILDDIESARDRGDTVHAACLRTVLRDFCKRCEISPD